MLTRPEFLTYVEEHILEYVKDPEEKQASIRQVTKNNNISLNGLCIGKGEEVCQPIIYLDSYYEDYREGADLGEILCRIGAVYEDSRADSPIDASLYRDYSHMRDLLFFRLVNYEKNKEQLKDCPKELVARSTFVIWSAPCRRPAVSASPGRSIPVFTPKLKSF